MPLTDVKVKCYRMPKWNEAEGLEENIVQNEWVCVTNLESLSLPRNYFYNLHKKNYKKCTLDKNFNLFLQIENS